jgi:hypothetical protein
MMWDFILIDLNSQGDAVMRYVKGWPKETVLEWLSRFGTFYTGMNFDEGGWGHFRSNFGLPAMFRFTENAELQVRVTSRWL